MSNRNLLLLSSSRLRQRQNKNIVIENYEKNSDYQTSEEDEVKIAPKVVVEPVKQESVVEPIKEKVVVEPVKQESVVKPSAPTAEEMNKNIEVSTETTETVEVIAEASDNLVVSKNVSNISTETVETVQVEKEVALEKSVVDTDTKKDAEEFTNVKVNNKNNKINKKKNSNKINKKKNSKKKNVANQ